mmetsp:Transcript_60551/g.148557  ORF Transcript_60551/g.148557 Transcript_60551/m.148557 type:complete len:183 (-) Transcript_60551:1271-1819(-)
MIININFKKKLSYQRRFSARNTTRVLITVQYDSIRRRWTNKINDDWSMLSSQAYVSVQSLLVPLSVLNSANRIDDDDLIQFLSKPILPLNPPPQKFHHEGSESRMHPSYAMATSNDIPPATLSLGSQSKSSTNATSVLSYVVPFVSSSTAPPPEAAPSAPPSTPISSSTRFKSSSIFSEQVK